MEKNREKLQKSVAPEKREKNKKYRLMEKEYQKRRQKYDDARLKVNNWVFSSIFAKILAYFNDFSKWRTLKAVVRWYINLKNLQTCQKFDKN